MPMKLILPVGAVAPGFTAGIAWGVTTALTGNGIARGVKAARLTP